MFGWINFISFVVSMIAWSWLYLESLQPMKKKEKKGEAAWKFCENLRIAAGSVMFITFANYILTIWYPIPWDATVSERYWISLVIGFGIGSIFSPIMIMGLIDAGKESKTPGAAKKIHSGIYKYIRHPQVLGDWPLFVVLALFANSWILCILSITFIIIYTPIMIILEERDLVKRFGDSYREYQKTTGVLFPKLINKE